MLGWGPEIFLIVPAVVVALSFHEYAHAYVSNYLGDPTARLQGRMTLNPLVHIDPIGLIMLIVFKFGWAKPVAVGNIYNLPKREKSFALVALAGPAMNLLLGMISTVLYFLARFFIPIQPLVQFLGIMVTYNVYLAIFNLLPIPPLDGSKLLFLFLPRSTVYRYLDVVGQYGMLVLILLVATNVVGQVVGPIAEAIITFFLTSFGRLLAALL